MSVQSDVDDAANSLITAVQAYLAAGGRPDLVAGWCISRLRLSDQRVARAINDSGTRFTSAPVDARSFASVG
jgi:hypothetical protein